jgi:CDP-6-deoxy-D-xylo-4-hexulose-3-dehydrase
MSIDKTKLIEKAKKYVDSLPKPKFIPGETYITSSGQVSDGEEAALLVDVALKGRFAEGDYSQQFDKDLRRFLNNQIRFSNLCNSGSSANLLAITAITAEEFGTKRAKPGDEVITVAAGFPTTLNPIIQNGLVPIFVDVAIGTYVPEPVHIEEMVNPKTKAIILAHPLGNPYDLKAIRDIADEYSLFLIEDSCDAIGSKYEGKFVGTFGDISTLSFYPAHQITGGEGGAILTDSPMLDKVIKSFGDWGRDCWCLPGKDNTCGKRFGWKLGSLPEGYDHKYTYSRMGYNLKATEMQAAILCAQLQKLPGFVEKRQHNWQRLHDGMITIGADRFLILPRATKHSEPSWFGFCMTVKETAPFSRNELIDFLERHKVGTRLLFGGNLIRQPAYKSLVHRAHDQLYNSDTIMRQTFWIGVWPGLEDVHIDYMLSVFEDFMKGR